MTLPQLRMEKTDLDNVPEIPVPDGYRLRTYEPGDESGLARVYAACDLGCTEPQAVRQRLVEREFFRPERLFVVERADEIVGTALAWEEPGDPPAGYLHMVAVVPAERGQGLGTLLTVAAIGQNRREGFRVQRLDTDDFRLPAIRLYLRLGYRPVLTHATHAARWEAVGEALRLPDILESARPEM